MFDYQLNVRLGLHYAGLFFISDCFSYRIAKRTLVQTSGSTARIAPPPLLFLWQQKLHVPDSRHIAKMASKSTNVAKTGKKNVETFTWTDSEVELLLETVKGYASECHYKGVDWESVEAKYEKITNIFIERYPKLTDGEPSPQMMSIRSQNRWINSQKSALRQSLKQFDKSTKRQLTVANEVVAAESS